MMNSGPFIGVHNMFGICLTYLLLSHAMSQFAPPILICLTPKRKITLNLGTLYRRWDFIQGSCKAKFVQSPALLG